MPIFSLFLYKFGEEIPLGWGMDAAGQPTDTCWKTRLVYPSPWTACATLPYPRTGEALHGHGRQAVEQVLELLGDGRRQQVLAQRQHLAELDVGRAEDLEPAPQLDREGQVAQLAVEQQPLELRRREVRVGDETGALADQLAVDARAPVGRAPVLPDDRVGYRLAGLAVPDDRGLALVGDPDPGNVGSGDAGSADGIASGREHARPDLLGIVLDMAGPGKVLGELLLELVARRRTLIAAEQIDQDPAQAIAMNFELPVGHGDASCA